MSIPKANLTLAGKILAGLCGLGFILFAIYSGFKKYKAHFQNITANPIITNTTNPNLAGPVTTTGSIPGTNNPVTTNPVTTNPVTTNPVTTNPVTTNPVTTNPVTTGSVIIPGTTNPVTTNPVTTGSVIITRVTTGSVIIPGTTNPVTNVSPAPTQPAIAFSDLLKFLGQPNKPPGFYYEEDPDILVSNGLYSMYVSSKL